MGLHSAPAQRSMMKALGISALVKQTLLVVFNTSEGINVVRYYVVVNPFFVLITSSTTSASPAVARLAEKLHPNVARASHAKRSRYQRWLRDRRPIRWFRR